MAELLDVVALPDLPSAAASRFHGEWMPQAEALLDKGADCLILVFPAADHTHTAWRLAAVQALAREHAPARVNAVTGGSAQAVAAAQAYLEAAQGITGQYLPLDIAGAGPVVEVAA